MTSEVWVPVPGFEGYYSVSSFWRVRSEERDEDRPGRPRVEWIRSQRTNKHGYLTLHLYRDGKSKTVPVHRLVCEAFHGAPTEEKPYALHRNGNRMDNRPENLYWGTPEDNMQDALTHGTNANARKTHCKRGHEYDEANTYVEPKGGRKCRACARENQKRFRLRGKA